jgi:hypothetical protein
MFSAKSPLWSKTLWTNLLAIVAMAVQSQTGYVIPLEAQTLLLAAGNLGLRTITRQPLDWSKIKITGVGCLLALAVASVTVAPLLGGCAFNALEKKPVLTELAIRTAAGRVLDQHPAWVEPARRISAEAIRALQQGDLVTLGNLQPYILELIPWQALTPEEEELLRVLITAIAAETTDSLARQGVKSPQEAVVQVATVLGWINQSAEIRAQRSTAAPVPAEPDIFDSFGAELESDRAKLDRILDSMIEEAAAKADSATGLGR